MTAAGCKAPSAQFRKRHFATEQAEEGGLGHRVSDGRLVLPHCGMVGLAPWPVLQWANLLSPLEHSPQGKPQQVSILLPHLTLEVFP